MRRLGWAIPLAIAVACGIDLPDTPGRACDDDHPCRAGRTCVAGRCFDNSEVDGGGGGGGSGGGGGGTGGGVGGGGGSSGYDAGRVLWSQGGNGFTGQDVLTNCMLEIDVVRNNRVVSTIASSAATQNRAVAINANASTLGLNGNGRLRGKFQLPQALSLRAPSTWFILGPPSAPVLELRFNATGALVVFSAANTISSVPFTQTVSGGFLPNRDYLVDVTWKRGQYREVAIDGTSLLQGSLTEPDGGFVKPIELRAGIYNYGSSPDAGWTITLSEWQLGEEPDTPMGP